MQNEVRAIYSSILGRGHRAVPTYAEVQRDVNTAMSHRLRALL